MWLLADGTYLALLFTDRAQTSARLEDSNPSHGTKAEERFWRLRSPGGVISPSYSRSLGDRTLVFLCSAESLKKDYPRPPSSTAVFIVGKSSVCTPCLDYFS